MSNRTSPLPILLLSLIFALSGAPGQAETAQTGPSQQQAQPQHSPTPAAPRAAEKNPYEERFRELDRDGDGYVTLGEWPLTPDKFAVVDDNKDGRLGRNELLAPNTLHRDRRAERFRNLDITGDGRLGPSERPRGDRTFDKLDKNRDGYVSRQEYAAGDPENVWNARTSPRTQSVFRGLDRNSDNRLGIREWTGPVARFHRLDRNHDGFVSPQELSRE
jgi:Ca2+-binding EF-hand superfamily protein